MAKCGMNQPCVIATNEKLLFRNSQGLLSLRVVSFSPDQATVNLRINAVGSNTLLPVNALISRDFNAATRTSNLSLRAAGSLPENAGEDLTQHFFAPAALEKEIYGLDATVPPESNESFPSFRYISSEQVRGRIEHKFLVSSASGLTIMVPDKAQRDERKAGNMDVGVRQRFVPSSIPRTVSEPSLPHRTDSRKKTLRLANNSLLAWKNEREQATVTLMGAENGLTQIKLHILQLNNVPMDKPVVFSLSDGEIRDLASIGLAGFSLKLKMLRHSAKYCCEIEFKYPDDTDLR